MKYIIDYIVNPIVNFFNSLPAWFEGIYNSYGWGGIVAVAVVFVVAVILVFNVVFPLLKAFLSWLFKPISGDNKNAQKVVLVVLFFAVLAFLIYWFFIK